MAQIATEIEHSVKRFLAALRLRMKIDIAYLYGSQAKGKATEWSDIDVAVVSPDFSADFFEERLALMRLASQIDDRIEPWPFTPETFVSNDPLVNEIKRTGVRVD
jgi:predicted nucleotidyltransferase